ncbi:glutamate-5-semialdehyde dehydrogenase [Alicyclobacillus sp. SO9]|uniref:glutamate-5-semialdehyde dehydrogenase n=1 Tax=Alicyclobacillus sp. SO9 TaxID=2665646 RepID=UPI0018E72048|nr:glutamate-5-semialdehyde dehydrogenase [Alicyclobacillus sp. SO9]QQE77712.1 glutamate-5-semialdehyde dehydrogenase [Alicyclobacillus sp. SO9]
MMDEGFKQYVHQKLKEAKKSTRSLAAASGKTRNDALMQMASALWDHREAILEANARDVQLAQRSGQSASRIDRLALTETRIQQMMDGMKAVTALPDKIGEVMETMYRPNGLVIEKVRVPMGVIAMVYEARPNVTADAAALCIKTGNAVVLRGGSDALESNTALVQALHAGLNKSEIPPAAVQFIDVVERESVDVLIRAKGLVDLAIPRGGAALIQRVVENARVPVIETGVGNCHVYVDRDANPAKATEITVNAKTNRPSVCNAAETLLVHKDIARSWLPQVALELSQLGVKLHVCDRSLRVLSSLDAERGKIVSASDDDWGREYLDLELSVKVVDTLDEAIQHIETYGTSHSEAIVTDDPETAEVFLRAVDAAAVYHNASTRFTDGFEFGFGAEIGISTQKLHARGPMGLDEITTYKYMIRGTGQIKQS